MLIKLENLEAIKRGDVTLQFRRWTRPSVAEPLARRAGLPTLFLPEGAAGFVDPATGQARLNHILVAVDHAPDPSRAVALAQGLRQALAPDGLIHLVHVGQDRPRIDAGSDAQIRWHAAEGAVVEAIGRIAVATSAELVVMATYGHDGFLDALRGSTTEQVLRTSGRALLAVPAI